MKSEKDVKYKKPPLIEALCEFRFQRTETIPHIIMGRFYEKIENEFPTVETHRGIDVKALDGMSESTIVMDERTKFANKDATKIIQIGRGHLMVSQLKPYEDYRSFRAFIEQTLNTYREIAKPRDIQFITLRYANKIDIKDNQAWEDIFNIGFTIPNMFQKFPDPYLLRMEFGYSYERDKLVVTLSTASQKEEATKAVKLEFDYVLSKPDKIDNNLLGWLDEAHNEIEKAFHACLTESFINTFEPE